MTTILNAARAAYAAGLCLLPTRDDGSKAPAVSTWQQYQTQRPTVTEMQAWRWDTRDGIGLIAGPVSGCREAWDFDDAAIFEAFVTTAAACGLGAVVARLRAGYEDVTPRGGRRWIVGYPPSVVWADTTLAKRPRPDSTQWDVLIELPTHSILAPSNGKTHPSGGAYTRASGDFASIASYTVEERAALIELARSFDQTPRREATPPQTAKARADGAQRPGDDFNQRTTWPELLEPTDWTPVYTRGETTCWRRPGKRDGISATTNHGGSDLLFVFTSSTEFDAEKSYSKFGAFTVLHHGGDFAAATRALAAAGYGDPTRPGAWQDKYTRQAERREPTAFARPAVAYEYGDCVLAPLPSIPFSGWFNRGALHIVAGSSGAGKTTLLVDLLRRQRRGESYLGHVGRRHDFLVVFGDRGEVSNRETFERMRIDRTTCPAVHIAGVPDGRVSADAIHAAVEAQDEMPAALFVEGADMLVDDPSKPAAVTVFLDRLLRLAEHYGLALILSLGAGKTKPKDSYALQRDRVFGSIMWTRRADTVCVLTIDGDGTTPRRHLAVLHRNAPAETFSLDYHDGLLVPSEPAAEGSRDQEWLAWFREAEAFTARQFRRAFPNLSGARAVELLDGFVALRVLRTKRSGDKTRYVYRGGDRPQWDEASQSHSKRDGNRAPDPDAETVPKTSGMGRQNGASSDEFPKENQQSECDPLIPPEIRPLSHSSSSPHKEWDKGRRPAYPHAREEAEPLPAFLAEQHDAAPLDESDAAFAARDAGDDTPRALTADDGPLAWHATCAACSRPFVDAAGHGVCLTCRRRQTEVPHAGLF